jgi:hypothetical protein
MMDIQDLNMSLFNKAMSYMPGTNQFSEKFSEYGSEADDEEIDVQQVIKDTVLSTEEYHNVEITLELNGPTTWLEFKFDSNEYTLENLVEVTFHTTAFDHEEMCYRYPAMDVEAMYNAYFGG